MRNRRYVQRKGPLVVYGNDAGIRCARRCGTEALLGGALFRSGCRRVRRLQQRRRCQDGQNVRLNARVGLLHTWCQAWLLPSTKAMRLSCGLSAASPHLPLLLLLTRRLLLCSPAAAPACRRPPAAARPSATCPAWRLPLWSA